MTTREFKVVNGSDADLWDDIDGPEDDAWAKAVNIMSSKKEMTIQFRVKGSSKSGNHGHAGRKGKVGGSAPKINAASLAIFDKYKDDQAWNKPIQEYMEANGLTLDDYKKANEALYMHNLSSGPESDKRLTDLWNSDAPEGKALRLMSVWQEWQIKNVKNRKHDFDPALITKVESWTQEQFNKSQWMYKGAKLADTPQRYALLLKKEMEGETIFYRKGGLDHIALSTTGKQTGARSGTSQFIPDRFYTFDEMKAYGYSLLAGARGMVGVTSADEDEFIWLKTQ